MKHIFIKNISDVSLCQERLIFSADHQSFFKKVVNIFAKILCNMATAIFASSAFTYFYYSSYVLQVTFQVS